MSLPVSRGRPARPVVPMSAPESMPQPRRPEIAQYLFWLALAAIAGYLVYLLGPVLSPFLFSLMLAYIFERLVSRLDQRGLSRTWAAVLVLALITATAVLLVLILVPLIQEQLTRISAGLPRFFEWAHTTLAPSAEQVCTPARLQMPTPALQARPRPT
jgi:predicted PurR-regulated permease PerM